MGRGSTALGASRGATSGVPAPCRAARFGVECAAVSPPATVPAPTVHPIRLTSAHLRRVIGEPPGPLTGFLANLAMHPVSGLTLEHARAARALRGRAGLHAGHPPPRRVGEPGHGDAGALGGGAARHRPRHVHHHDARGAGGAGGHSTGCRRAGSRRRWWAREAWQALQAHLATGKGALLVTAHFGNWEMLGEILIHRGVPLNALVRPLKGALNMRIAENRVRAGAGLIYPKGAVQEIGRRAEPRRVRVHAAGPGHPDEGRVRAVLREAGLHHAGHGGGGAADGRAGLGGDGRARRACACACTSRAPSRRRRRRRGRTPSPSTPRSSPRRSSGCIRQYPEQWLWLHRRWKYPPPSP